MTKSLQDERMTQRVGEWGSRWQWPHCKTGKSGSYPDSHERVATVLGFYGCDKDHDQKQLRKNISFCCTPLRSYSISEGSQGRNLEARTETEPIEECCLWTALVACPD